MMIYFTNHLSINMNQETVKTTIFASKKITPFQKSNGLFHLKSVPTGWRAGNFIIIYWISSLFMILLEFSKIFLKNAGNPVDFFASGTGYLNLPSHFYWNSTYVFENTTRYPIQKKKIHWIS